MTETSWALEGVDPETLDHAVGEARRLGVSLCDYVTNMVLKKALSEQVGALAAAEVEQTPTEPGDFGVRHRFRSLERRLESSVGSLEGALHALDASLFDVSARVGELEGLAGDTAHGLQQALAEMGNQLAAVRLHISDVEENSVTRDGETRAATASLSQTLTGFNYRTETISHRIEDVEIVARRADANAAVLADAHEALKHAVAGDFSELAHDLNERLSNGLHDVAAAADEAASQADAAIAQLIVELRGAREALERSVADSADETRRRMRTAFNQAGQRIEALSDRLDAVETASQRTNEQFRIQLADVEDAAQTALEETAESLRQAGAALAADLQRSVADGRAALESVHSDLASEIVELRERQQGGLARLKQVDATAAVTAAGLSELREAMLRRIGESESGAADLVARAQNELGQELDTLTSRFTRFERDAAETQFTLRAETERVEAAVLASLEKLSGDIAQGDAAGMTMIDQLRQQHADTATRLAALDVAVGAQTQLAERINRAESALNDLHADRTDEELAQRIEQLRARLAAYENHASVAADGVSDLVRMLGRVTAQTTEVSAKSEERLQQLEATLAEQNPQESLGRIEQRMGQIEQRQGEALEQLRADIVRFVSDNDRRLAALENPEIDYNLAAEFDALRRRVEDRILGVEQRSVRTLEQVADTVAMLEQRFTGRHEGERQSA